MTMRKALIWSALMHIAAVAVMWFGVPSRGFDVTEPVVIVAVDIADFSETTERKAPRARPKPPEPVEETPPEPPPAPKEPDLAMIPPPPMPEPEPEPEPIPVPAPAEAKDKPKTLLPARPRPKPPPPKPKDDFDSVLKTVELLERDKAPKPPPEAEAPDNFLDELASVLDDPEPPPEEQTQQAPVLGNRLTASEEDAIRRQIEPCWNVPVGARNPEELIVTLRLRLQRDGSVISVEVLDTARQRSDPFFRAAADSARRAVMNQRCTPFNLPPDKYDQWKEMVMDFNPAKMVGR